MKIIEKYDGTKTYMFPNGKLATKEAVLSKFESALTYPHIVETDQNGQVMFALQNLSAMRTFYNIDKSLSEDEAIAKIQEIVNTPEPKPEPSAEERMAAAMEFQNMMMLSDVQ